jgi:two-component system KDP operon response regulator KdpE
VTARTRILLVDDEPAILRAVGSVLDAHGYETLAAQTGERAIARISSDQPGLVMLDLGLPDMTGVDVIRRVRSFEPTTPIIVLSAHGDDASKVAALDAGADDYISKPFSIPELLARVRTALRHAQRIAPGDAARLERGDVVVDLIAHTATCAGQLLALTPTQFDLLTCFCRHADRVLTQRMLMAEVWDDPDATGSANVRMFVSQLRRELAAAAGHAHHIVTEPGVGYRFVAKAR